ncbi:uncharacterized protein F4812DRAFT_444512 [Daldinia caldariorum]|uniref:uncharacterized protein n=1 Tax=Daldinia caldariorum TaxID=326644 RepID=UPI0020088C07|nr:uncharacterized protein F4812DRAFT_444512 [Daldinia caldariorum]KAI1464084.1 hypothetical protein F4812DRAFT_444512 [Daldinia caldariorum]
MSFIEAIGVLSGVLGILQFGIDHFPKDDGPKSTIRITVGLDTPNGLHNAGGDLPDVRLWNEAGKFIGMHADPGHVADGGFGDIEISHEDDTNQQPAYALFSANNDAICIAHATVTFPGNERYTWVGDWGRQCGGSWYYSNIYVDSSNRKVDCLWIDGDNDQPQSGFQVHWPEFVRKDGEELPAEGDGMADKVDYLCNSGPPFKMYKYDDVKDPSSITYWVLDNKRSEDEGRDRKTATAYGPSKNPTSAKFSRQLARNSTVPAMPKGQANRLVVSNNEQHTAEELCGSATSYGPDFLDLKNEKFCRMSDKTLWPICSSSQEAEGCFNAELKQLKVNDVYARDTPYDNIVDWTE